MLSVSNFFFKLVDNVRWKERLETRESDVRYRDVPVEETRVESKVVLELCPVAAAAAETVAKETELVVAKKLEPAEAKLVPDNELAVLNDESKPSDDEPVAAAKLELELEDTELDPTDDELAPVDSMLVPTSELDPKYSEPVVVGERLVRTDDETETADEKPATTYENVDVLPGGEAVVRIPELDVEEDEGFVEACIELQLVEDAIEVAVDADESPDGV